jgi:Zn-dependent M28 family amino/carboxypeptidase
MSGKFAFALVTTVLFTVPSFADPVDTAAQLRDHALTDQTAWNVLESLTTEIGARPIGSPAYNRSRDWAVKKFQELGFTDIKVETYTKDTWQRGPESAEVIAPFPHKLALIGLGYSLPTPKGGITAEIAVFPSLAAMMALPPGALKGKIAVVDQKMARMQDGSGYGAAVAARYGDSEAAKRGAVAYLVRSISTSTNRSPHTGTSLGGPEGPHIPTAALGVPDADLLAAMAKRGPVKVHLSLASTIKPKSVLFNVSGEIKGREKPDEVIVIGGHLDSWDPGTGAIDDGAGVAITTAAAKLIGDLPQHPKRTIRVVMWGSEENGGASEAYANAHQGELAKMVLAGESDLGADRVLKVALPQQLPGLAEVLLPLGVVVPREPARHGGSDISDLVRLGVPVLAVSNDATRYFDYHHSADDTLAIVDPEGLKQNVAVWASTIYLAAETGADFRASPAPK